jgi:hypothetical protein
MQLQSITSFATPMAATAISLAAGISPQSAAVLAVATYAMENTQRAAAGPLTYWSCVLGCEMMAPPFIPVCIAACLPFLAAPTP